MHIVLVDPSRAVRAAIARPLESRGHLIRAFADPCQALATIKADQSIDGLITSAELTPISGIELCWETRLVAGGHRPIYIVLMSSHDDEDTLIEALDSGADDFITKPPHPEELYARLRAAERIVTMQRDLIRLATTDPLTGLCNRRALFERAAEICQEANGSAPVSAILFDIDHFKDVNDRHGHHVGDAAIQAVAEELRDQELVGRLGGDEFCVLLNGHDLSAAVEIAARLCRRFSALNVPAANGPVGLTCSLGVSELVPGETIDALLKRADLALYRAKIEGRNRVSTPPRRDWVEQYPRQMDCVTRATPR